MAELVWNNKKLFVSYINTLNKATRFDLNKDGLLVKLGSSISIDHVNKYLLKNFNKFYNYYNDNKKYFDTPTYTMLFNKEYSILYAKIKDKFIITTNTIYIKNTYQYKYDLVLKDLKTKLLEDYLSALNLQIKEELYNLGINLATIKIKKLTNKFAYCNITNKEIVFSVFCVKLAPELIKHILFHEYSHFLEKRHNQRFYNILAKLDKNAKINNKLIKKINIIKEEY